MPPATHSFACNTARCGGNSAFFGREDFFGKKSCRNSLNINKSIIDNLQKFVKKYDVTKTIVRKLDSGNGSISRSQSLLQRYFQITICVIQHIKRINYLHIFH